MAPLPRPRVASWEESSAGLKAAPFLATGPVCSEREMSCHEQGTKRVSGAHALRCGQLAKHLLLQRHTKLRRD